MILDACCILRSFRSHVTGKFFVDVNPLHFNCIMFYTLLCKFFACGFLEMIA